VAQLCLAKTERGAALVELALVLTLLVILTFGVMEYGWMFYQMQQVTAAAREGARDAVVPDATAADVLATVDGLMASLGLGGSGYTVNISPLNIEELDPGEPVTVTVMVPYGNIELLGMSYFPTPPTLTSRVTMAKEGP